MRICTSFHPLRAIFHFEANVNASRPACCRLLASDSVFHQRAHVEEPWRITQRAKFSWFIWEVAASRLLFQLQRDGEHMLLGQFDQSACLNLTAVFYSRARCRASSTYVLTILLVILTIWLRCYCFCAVSIHSCVFVRNLNRLSRFFPKIPLSECSTSSSSYFHPYARKKEYVYAVSVHVSLLSQHHMVDQHNMGILGCCCAAAPSHGKTILMVKTVQIGLKLWKPPNAVTERIFLHARWRATSFKQNLTQTFCPCWLTAATLSVSYHFDTLKRHRVKATPHSVQSNSRDSAWKLHSVLKRTRMVPVYLEDRREYVYH